MTMINGRNISVSAKNGYTLDGVRKAKKYLAEIGSNKRNFDFHRLIDMYNDMFGAHESYQICKCQSPKYYNAIANYYKYGKLTLINNGVCTEADIEEDEIEASEAVSEAKVEDTPSEVKEEPTEEKEEPKKRVGRPKKNDE